MGDLTGFLPEESETVKAIFAWHKARGDAEPQRGYLGASIVGHECDRFLWLTFRGAVREEVEGRIYRLFETGDLAEERFVRELRAIGCEVIDRDPETGEQHEVSALGGHFSGHMDGAVLGVPEAPKTWHVLEAKTAKDKNWKKLKAGVKVAEPKHYAQMQAYMGHTGMKRALYLCANKDTDELYGERVSYDSAFFRGLMERATRIVRAVDAPERVAERPDDFRCKFCPAYALCWGTNKDGSETEAAVPIPAKTCKTCCHVTPDTEVGGWVCEKFRTKLEDTDVGAECPAHLLLPGLIPFAEPVDSDRDWVEFQSQDGTVWRHGQGEGCWTTEQLMRERGPLDQGDLPEALLAVDLDDLPLLARYPWSDSERLWDGPTADLASAIQEHMGISAETLGECFTPKRTQDDHLVNAAEYEAHDVGYLVVDYKDAGQAAIWKGKA